MTDIVTELVSDAARKSYVVASLSRLERLLEESEKLYKMFPQEYREVIDTISEDPETYLRKFHIMILAFSQIPETTRDDLRRMIYEATSLINSCSGENYEQNEEDQIILEGIFILVQRMKAISKRNLVKFLGAIGDQEPCELKVVCTRKGTDVAFKHHFDDFGERL